MENAGSVLTTVAVVRAAAKFKSGRLVPVPTWFEGKTFVALSDPCVAGAICAFMLVGGAQPTTNMLIAAFCEVSLSKPAAIAAIGIFAFWTLITASFWKMRKFWKHDGILQRLTHLQNDIHEATLKQIRFNSAIGAMICVGVVLWDASLVLYIAMEEDVPFLLPPTECVPSGSRLRKILKFWALSGYVPGLLICVMAQYATWVCLLLACGLGQDEIKQLSQRLQPRACALGDDAWNTRVRTPVFNLVKQMSLLRSVAAPLVLFALGFLTLGYALIPFAVTTSDLHIAALSALSFFAPTYYLWQLAGIGSSCGDLSERLNHLNEHEDLGRQRVMQLQTYLSNLNHQQGLGVSIFGVALDERKLKKQAAASLTTVATFAIYLAEFGADTTDGNGTVGSYSA